MKQSKRYTLKFSRKRKGKTNYKKRLALLKSGKPRLVVRKSLNNIYLQLIKYNPNGDVVVLSYASDKLKKFGWPFQGNVPTAYLTGYVLGGMAKKKKIVEAIVDIGFNLSKNGCLVYAAVKGVIDSGLKVPVDESILPSQERIKGQHISQFASKLKQEKEKFEKQFSGLIKKNVNPEEITKIFENVKTKIKGELEK